MPNSGRTRTRLLMALVAFVTLAAAACVQPPGGGGGGGGAVVITASSATIQEGDPVPAITPSYLGLAPGQTQTAIPPACSTTVTPASPVGTYPTTCTGAVHGSSTITYVDGTITVTAAAPLPVLTITAPTLDTELGQPVPALTPTYSGLVDGDTAPATEPTCTTDATAASPIGRYTSTCSGAVDPGYDIVHVDATVTVHPTPGLGAYDPTGHATTVAAGSNGASVGPGTLQVAAGTAAGFAGYTNLTVESSNGPQPMFCKLVGAVTLATCSSAGGSGTLATGNVVVDKPAHQFDVFTVAGGAAAISPTSLTILSDVPAADRGMASVVRVTAGNDKGLIVYTQSAAPTGTFTLTYGICRAGTATYAAASPTCATGTIEYRSGVESTLGADAVVSMLGGTRTDHVYRNVRSAVDTPTTVPQGSTVRSLLTLAPIAIPRFQLGSPLGDLVVNGTSRMAAVIPIPAGMTYVSSRVLGGDAASSGVATVTYCTTFGAAPCHAKPATGNYSNNSLPYLVVAIPPSAAATAGGAQITLPMIEVTMTATGSVGTIGAWKLTELLTRTTGTEVVSVTIDLDGYPTDDSDPAVTPPASPPTTVATTTIS